MLASRQSSALKNREILGYLEPARILVMMSTSAQLPLCVYCGTARPADRSQCPQCGRPWIDVRVGSLAESREYALVGAAATTETPNLSAGPPKEPAEPETDVTLDLTATDTESAPAPGFRRAIPIVLGLSAAAVVAMFALGILEGEPPDEVVSNQAIAPSTTPAPSTTAELPSTTAPPPPTSTIPTTTIPAPSSVAVAGDPVKLSRLTLKADAIGPIETGTPASEAIGRLVASLGTPEEVGAAGPEYGLCEDEEGRFVRWAQLTAIVSGTLSDGSFVGYRFEEPAIPTSLIDLTTPSGVRLGDTIATLNETYARYTITYETIGEASTFSLFEDQELLLWGPVSSTEDTGRVEGIFSPPSCNTT